MKIFSKFLILLFLFISTALAQEAVAYGSLRQLTPISENPQDYVEVSRAEFLSMLLKNDDEKTEYKGSLNCFKDIKNSTYIKDICAARSLGLINTNVKKMFYPERKITYKEAVLILSRKNNQNSLLKDTTNDKKSVGEDVSIWDALEKYNYPVPFYVLNVDKYLLRKDAQILIEHQPESVSTEEELLLRDRYALLKKVAIQTRNEQDEIDYLVERLSLELGEPLKSSKDLESLDVSTFRYEQGVVYDKKNVYCYDENNSELKRTSINSMRIKMIAERVLFDGQHIYENNAGCFLRIGLLEEGMDHIEYNFFKKGNEIFEFIPSDSRDVWQFRKIEGSNADEFENLMRNGKNTPFYTDKSHVYLFEENSYQIKKLNFNGQDFKILSSYLNQYKLKETYLVKDQYGIYLVEFKSALSILKLPVEDIKSFEVYHENDESQEKLLGYDNSHIYTLEQKYQKGKWESVVEKIPFKFNSAKNVMYEYDSKTPTSYISDGENVIYISQNVYRKTIFSASDTLSVSSWSEYEMSDFDNGKHVLNPEQKQAISWLLTQGKGLIYGKNGNQFWYYSTGLGKEIFVSEIDPESVKPFVRVKMYQKEPIKQLNKEVTLNGRIQCEMLQDVIQQLENQYYDEDNRYSVFPDTVFELVKEETETCHLQQSSYFPMSPFIYSSGRKNDSFFVYLMEDKNGLWLLHPEMLQPIKLDKQHLQHITNDKDKTVPLFRDKDSYYMLKNGHFEKVSLEIKGDLQIKDVVEDDWILSDNERAWVYSSSTGKFTILDGADIDMIHFERDNIVIDEMYTYGSKIVDGKNTWRFSLRQGSYIKL